MFHIFLSISMLLHMLFKSPGMSSLPSPSINLPKLHGPTNVSIPLPIFLLVLIKFSPSLNVITYEQSERDDLIAWYKIQKVQGYIPYIYMLYIQSLSLSSSPFPSLQKCSIYKQMQYIHRRICVYILLPFLPLSHSNKNNGGNEEAVPEEVTFEQNPE